jgi:hypothetical protein
MKSEWSESRPIHFTPVEEHWYPIRRSFVGLGAGLSLWNKPIVTWEFTYFLLNIWEFCCGATTQIRPRSPLWGFLEHTHTHTHTHTHNVMWLLWTSDQPVSEAATYATHNKHNGLTSIPSSGFEPGVPAIKQLQTYALDLLHGTQLIILSVYLLLC